MLYSTLHDPWDTWWLVTRTPRIGVVDTSVVPLWVAICRNYVVQYCRLPRDWDCFRVTASVLFQSCASLLLFSNFLSSFCLKHIYVTKPLSFLLWVVFDSQLEILKHILFSQGPEELPRSGEDDEEQGERSVRDDETEDRHCGSTIQRLTPQPPG